MGSLKLDLKYGKCFIASALVPFTCDIKGKIYDSIHKCWWHN